MFLLHNAYDPLNTVKTFAWKDDIKALLPLPPFFDEVFTSEGTSQLTELYKQMYPDRDFSNILVPVSYRKFGRLMLAGNLVGSEMPGPNSILSAVIMAYWYTTRCDLSNINYSTMQVGVVQYFLRHRIITSNATNETSVEDHLFAKVKWKVLHRHYDWFGAAATCVKIFRNFPALIFYQCRGSLKGVHMLLYLSRLVILQKISLLHALFL